MDDAIDQWQRLLACVDAEGGHFEANVRPTKFSWEFYVFDAFMQTFQCSCEKALFSDFAR